MTLAPGSRLGPYEILFPLGAGGMGEVYSARDTRLDRTVAIKVLPSHLAKDATLRERFEREARADARGADGRQQRGDRGWRGQQRRDGDERQWIRWLDAEPEARIEIR